MKYIGYLVCTIAVAGFCVAFKTPETTAQFFLPASLLASGLWCLWFASRELNSRSR
jgi:hypothetical protein